MNKRIKLIGLPDEFELLPLRALRAIEGADAVVMQSGKIGCAAEIEKAAKRCETLDGLFETADDFDALYLEGARFVAGLPGEDIVFCAVGGLRGNGFVQKLKEQVQTETVCDCDPAALAVMLATDFFEMGDYAVLEARSLAEAHINTSLALVVRGIDNRYTAGDTALALGEYYAPDTSAVLICGGEARLLPLEEVARVAEFGAGACLALHAVPLTQKVRYGFYDLVEVMKILRGPDGCPWDAEQTHKTLRQYILEESYEVLDAVDADDMDALYDELGDVLLQIVFHAEIARQCGEFTDLDVTTAVCKKMILRHPHIFGSVTAETPDEVVKNWEAIKRQEKGNETFVSVLTDVPKTMGAMMRAYKLQKKAGAIGFDWPDAKEAFQKVLEEVEELERELDGGSGDAIEAEAGDLLFSVVNVLRKVKINPEVALTRTCEKFIQRFRYMEAHAPGELPALSLEELDGLWEAAKAKGDES